jgi:hypothetical protein
MEQLSEKARQARNAYNRAYARKWRQKNPDKCRKYTNDYWERKADSMLKIKKTA